MAEIRFGIVGSGIMGNIYAKCARELQPSIKISFNDIDKKKSGMSLESLVEWSTHLAIATPPDTHYNVFKETQSILTKNNWSVRPILISKPVFTNKDQLVELDKVFCGMTERYNSAYLDFKKNALSMDLPVYINFYRRCRQPIYENANLIKEVAVHDIDLLFDCFLNRLPENVEIFGVNSNDFLMEGNCFSHFMRLKFKEVVRGNNSMNCSITSMWGSKNETKSASFIEAFYSNGTIIKVDTRNYRINEKKDFSEKSYEIGDRNKEVNRMLFDFFAGQKMDALRTHYCVAALLESLK